jgi:UDP-4-amino-4,6-dideoxy-N-acetyl-beta-L-altrosamine N-acetyltransferase
MKRDKNKIVKIFIYKDTPIGQFNVNVDHQKDRCSWGFFIGEAHTPYKSGTIMGYLALEYIFENIRIRKTCAEVLAYNSASIN